MVAAWGFGWACLRTPPLCPGYPPSFAPFVSSTLGLVPWPSEWVFVHDFVYSTCGAPLFIGLGGVVASVSHCKRGLFGPTRSSSPPLQLLPPPGFLAPLGLVLGRFGPILPLPCLRLHNAGHLARVCKTRHRRTPRHLRPPVGHWLRAAALPGLMAFWGPGKK